MKIFLLFLFSSWVCSVPVARSAQDLLKKSIESNANGDYASAISKYIEAYNLDANIVTLPDEGVLRNASAYFVQFLKNNPADINSLMWMGTIHTLKGNLQAAIESYQKVVHFSPRSPEGLEADQEILRLEGQIRGQQQTLEDKQTQKMERGKDLDRTRQNLSREIKAQFQTQIEGLRSQIQSLEVESRSLRSEAEKARNEVDGFKAKIEELKKQNAHHRRLYLIYKRKAGVE
jgi:tetratricopeptide (TPR) repeat protein